MITMNPVYNGDQIPACPLRVSHLTLPTSQSPFLSSNLCSISHNWSDTVYHRHTVCTYTLLLFEDIYWKELGVFTIKEHLCIHRAQILSLPVQSASSPLEKSSQSKHSAAWFPSQWASLGTCHSLYSIWTTFTGFGFTLVRPLMPMKLHCKMWKAIWKMFSFCSLWTRLTEVVHANIGMAKVCSWAHEPPFGALTDKQDAWGLTDHKTTIWDRASYSLKNNLKK